MSVARTAQVTGLFSRAVYPIQRLQDIGLVIHDPAGKEKAGPVDPLCNQFKFPSLPATIGRYGNLLPGRRVAITFLTVSLQLRRNVHAHGLAE